MTAAELHHGRSDRRAERLLREALVAAIDATPGLSAIDGSITDVFAGRADAAVVAAEALDSGWRRLLVDGHWDDGPAVLS